MKDLDQILRRGGGLPNGQPAPLQVAAPMNDVQLIALVAAHLSDSPPAAVQRAINLIAEALVQYQGGALGRALLVAQQRAAASAIEG